LQARAVAEREAGEAVKQRTRGYEAALREYALMVVETDAFAKVLPIMNAVVTELCAEAVTEAVAAEAAAAAKEELSMRNRCARDRIVQIEREAECAAVALRRRTDKARGDAARAAEAAAAAARQEAVDIANAGIEAGVEAHRRAKEEREARRAKHAQALVDHRARVAKIEAEVAAAVRMAAQEHELAVARVQRGASDAEARAFESARTKWLELCAGVRTCRAEVLAAAKAEHERACGAARATAAAEDRRRELIHAERVEEVRRENSRRREPRARALEARTEVERLRRFQACVASAAKEIGAGGLDAPVQLETVQAGLEAAAAGGRQPAAAWVQQVGLCSLCGDDDDEGPGRSGGERRHHPRSSSPLPAFAIGAEYNRRNKTRAVRPMSAPRARR